MKRITYLFAAPLLLLAFAAPAMAAVPDGALVRSEGDPKVYYVEAGKKRWIESAEAFRVQGFSWNEIVVVGAGELGALPEGERVGVRSRFVMPDEGARIPDLAPYPIRDIFMRRVAGRTELVFSSPVWNRGRGTFSIEAVAASVGVDMNTRVAQRVIADDGGTRLKEIGDLFWHGIHDHYHYGDFGEYTLSPEMETGDVAAATVYKTTFCMFDTIRVTDAEPEGRRETRQFAGCGRELQGISVGWSDVYYYDLPDQNVDVTGFEAGLYRFTFSIDPLSAFVEGDYGNNESVVILNMDPSTLKVETVFSGAPFQTSLNRYAEGMVVRGDVLPSTFIISGGKKKPHTPVGSETVHVLPQGVVNAIPAARLMKSADSPKVYFLNDYGYRRHILDYPTFLSYGWTAADIAVLSAGELASYPESDLIRASGSDDVFSTSERRFVGRHSDLPGLGYEPFSVHVVNDTDFETHMMETIAEGLEIPWSIAFLPDGDMLVTERPGRLRRIGTQNATINLPAAVQSGEGGLMGVALHPDFATNQLLYLYYTDAGRTNRIERFKLDGNRLLFDRLIIGGIPGAIYHDGGRIAFGPDGMLYVTTGDATTPALAQDLSSLAGKTLRLTPDGGIPEGNPFGTPVWSYGHRNPQGIAWDAQGRMWLTEHGRSGAATGYDELNLILRGGNYGWPDIQGDAVKGGMKTPQAHSGPTVTWAPASLAYLDGVLYFGGLRGESVYRATLDDAGGLAGLDARLVGRFGRIRDIVVGPDGALYITTSNRDGRGTVHAGDDRIVKIHPDFLRVQR